MRDSQVRWAEVVFVVIGTLSISMWWLAQRSMNPPQPRREDVAGADIDGSSRGLTELVGEFVLEMIPWVLPIVFALSVLYCLVCVVKSAWSH